MIMTDADNGALIDLRGLRVATESQQLFAADSIRILPGACTVIALPSGRGRTSLAHYLAALPEWNQAVSVTVHSRTSIRHEVAASLVPQGYFRYTTESRVLDQLTLRAENESLPADVALTRALQAATLLRIEHLLDTNPLTASGGELQRIAIASAMVAAPELIVFDEPFGELDAAGRSTVERALTETLPRQGISTCVITSAIPRQLPERAMTYVFCTDAQVRPFHSTTPNERSADLYFIENADGVDVLCETVKPGLVNQRNALLALRDITFTYPGRKAPALTMSTLDFYPGQRLGITGPNGAGKSTLISVLLGFQNIQQGTILIGDSALTKAALRLLRRRTGYLQQTYHHQFIGATVKEELEFSHRARQLRLPQNLARRDAASAMTILQLATAFMLDEVLERIVDEVSGQQRRLLGCMAAILEAVDLLILDEPTAGLDGAGRRALRAALASLVGQNVCVLILSHDLQFLRSVCDFHLALESGRIKRFEHLNNYA